MPLKDTIHPFPLGILETTLNTVYDANQYPPYLMA